MGQSLIMPDTKESLKVRIDRFEVLINRAVSDKKSGFLVFDGLIYTYSDQKETLELKYRELIDKENRI